MGYTSVTASAFEQDLMDYLYARYGELTSAAVLFARAGHGPVQAGRLVELLPLLVEPECADEIRTAMLDDLQRALESFARACGTA